MRFRTTTILILTIALMLAPMSALAGDQPQNAYYIVGFVYHDLDEDLRRDAGEPGIEGVEIRLTTDAESLETTFTDSNGLFLFSPSTNGYYTLEEIDPPGYKSTTSNTQTLFFYPGYTGTVLFGDVALPNTSLGGTVFDDVDRNGAWDPGEPGVPGADLQLFDSEGEPLASASSGAEGTYSFPELEPGTYTLVETDPEGYFSTTPNRQQIEIAADSTSPEVNFGDFQPAEGEFTEVDLAILGYFDLPLSELLELREGEGWGYGEIARALFLVDSSEATLAEILAMRAQGAGWGEITKALGGDADLNGFNLGLIMSGRAAPQGAREQAEAVKASRCGLDSEQYAGYVEALGQGLVNKGCRLAAALDAPAQNILSMLENGMSLQEIESSFEDPPAALPSPETGKDHEKVKGPKPCKGKNKNDPGC